MSIECLSHVLNLDVGDPTRKLILLGYANHAHADGTTAWPSVAKIAAYAGCSTRSVQRHLRTLVAEGFLTEGDQQVVGHLRADRRPTVYDVVMTARPGDSLSPRDAKPVHAEPTPVRDDTVSPRTPEPGDTVSPRDTSRGDTGGSHGVTPVTPRGDKAVSPKPSRNHQEEPNDDSSLRSSSSPRQRSTRLPDDWEPSEALREWFRSKPELRNVDPIAETEKFCDHWRAAPGQRGVKLDWDSTWRNWIRRAHEQSGGMGRPMPNRHLVAADDPGRARLIGYWSNDTPNGAA